MGGHLAVMLGAYTGAMLQCIRCREMFAGFDQVEPNIDSFGLHFMCPTCGRRNNLQVVGRDEYGALIEQCEPEPLTSGGDSIPRRR
ncbi:hypothetical protein D5301_12840 [Stenotrophomonas sp. MH181796]|nr:hypothetical protein [Stenotrophomonas sp. MH181796]